MPHEEVNVPGWTQPDWPLPDDDYDYDADYNNRKSEIVIM